MDHEPPASASSLSVTAAASGFMRQGDAWCEVTELGRNTFRVRLGGVMRSAWLATLCVGLSERRLSIHQAHARRGPDGLWIAELTAIALEGAPDPRTVPYIDLANAAVTHAPALLRLDACRAVESRDHGGTLLLELEADDSLGLLGALLAKLATVMLFPIEMHIETRMGRAHDALWLAGMGGHAPSTGAAEALQRLVRTWKRV